MAAIVLSSEPLTAHATHSLRSEVERQLALQFETVRTFHLSNYDIAHCMGEFDCFVMTPVRCRIHDEDQEIERVVHDTGLVVLVTPLYYVATVTPEARSRGEVPARRPTHDRTRTPPIRDPENTMNLSVPQLQALVLAATLAPSSHNTQSWLFRLEGQVIKSLTDRTRALPVNDPDDVINLSASILMAIALVAYGIQLMPSERREGVASGKYD